jgi:hypothetical protein
MGYIESEAASQRVFNVQAFAVEFQSLRPYAHADQFFQAMYWIMGKVLLFDGLLQLCRTVADALFQRLVDLHFLLGHGLRVGERLQQPHGGRPLRKSSSDFSS